MTRDLTPRLAGCYVAVQIAGAMLANAMFALDPIAMSTKVRTGFPIPLSERVAMFCVGVVICVGRTRAAIAPLAAYIIAAYWFTASTSFANPAVTIGRAFSDAYAGIRPADVAGFIAAQGIGAAVGGMLFGWLVPVPHAT